MAMQNGKEIMKLIYRLGQIDPQWEKTIRNRSADLEGEAYFLVNRLLSLLRAELKIETAERVSEWLQAEGVSAETAEYLVKKMYSSLQFYFSFSVLREMEEKDQTMLFGMLASIYEKYIVRFERGYIQEICPETCSCEDWEEIADRMGFLTDYYVSKSYTRKGIAKDLMEESGLQEETCEYWADLIDRNYLLLKLNYITQELENSRSAIRKDI